MLRGKVAVQCTRPLKCFGTSKSAIVIFGLLGLALITSCQNDNMANLDDKKCQASGGKVVYGIIGEVCAMPTDDIGKVCDDISQCEGLCLSDGKCSEWDNNFGCTDVLVEGEPVTICID